MRSTNHHTFFWIHTLYTHYIPLQYSSHHSYKTDVKVLNKLIDMIWIDLDIYIQYIYIYPINYPMKHNVNPALVNPDYFIGRLPKKKLFKWVLKLENCLSISLKKKLVADIDPGFSQIKKSNEWWLPQLMSHLQCCNTVSYTNRFIYLFRMVWSNLYNYNICTCVYIYMYACVSFFFKCMFI